MYELLNKIMISALSICSEPGSSWLKFQVQCAHVGPEFQKSVGLIIYARVAILTATAAGHARHIEELINSVQKFNNRDEEKQADILLELPD